MCGRPGLFDGDKTSEQQSDLARIRICINRSVEHCNNKARRKNTRIGGDYISRVGRPPVNDPTISKSVTLKASQWYQIEQSKLSRKAFFSKMFDRIDNYINEITELRERDYEQCSLARLLAICSNKALAEDKADIHMMIVDIIQENRRRKL